VRDRLASEVGAEVIGLSAVTGAGLADLVRRVVAKLSEVKEAEAPLSERIVPPHQRDEILL
jgi:hypothetical protein